MVDLRQRTAATTTSSTMSNKRETETEAFVPGAGLSANSLIDSDPQHHGVVLKLHIPILYSILPVFLQRIILSWPFLSFLAPQWKQRHLVLCGSYLYKFKDRTSQIPKGRPFELEGIQVDLIREGRDIPEIGSLPPAFSSIFSISTLRRRQYFAVADNEEAMVWIRSIQEAKQATITRNLGHASNLPYPSSWKYFDTLGKSLVKSKDRIRERLEESRLREMEMTDFAEGGPIPRTYHG